MAQKEIISNKADDKSKQKYSLKSLLPYILAIFAFIIIGYSYAPYTLEGKVVNQSDISSWQGMAHEIVEWNDAHPDDPTYWTNSMFSGMPANTISIKYKGDLTQYLYDALFVGQRPASYLIISLIGAFLMFLAFGMNIYLAFLGAIAVSFCSYNMQIIQVGHNTKMIAIAFAPWVIASIAYAYRKKYLIGAALFGLTLSFQIKANHPQISYYLAIIILGFVVWKFVESIKNKTIGKFLKTSVTLLIAGLLGIATNINHLWPTYEYGKQSMRGGSEIAKNEDGTKRDGLDIEYATQWSYGLEETPNLFIPNFNGGASAGALSTESETYKTLTTSGYSGANQIINQLPLYWGPQAFTAGPMYMGAISIFLFILGLFVVKGGKKWWLVCVSLLAILLSWGYHFMAPTEFFFKYVPMYSKFRTVSMILIILQITIPLLAIFALNGILNSSDNQEHTLPLEKKKKFLFWSVVISGGFALIMVLMPSLAGNFTSPIDSSLPQDIAAALSKDRAALLRSDAIRTLIFILLSAVVIYFAMGGKLKTKYAYFALIILVFIDLWGVDKRYLNSSHFVTKEEFNSPLSERAVDGYILEAGKADNNLSYRVLDLSIDPFNNAYTSYWHKTIGGYSPAKLQRYQDIISKYIQPEINAIIGNIQSSNATTLEEANDAIGNQKVLSMLNTKYIIIGENQPPLTNPYTLGNCWFAESVEIVDGADQEFEKLEQINPATTAVVEREFCNSEPLISEFVGKAKLPIVNDSVAMNIPYDFSKIELKEYAPNKLIYSYSSAVDKFALFSEVYYAPGWRATFTGTLDGKKVENEELNLLRANYILRALALPKGEGEITFKYQPQSIVKGAIYSKISSIILLLLVAGAILLEHKHK